MTDKNKILDTFYSLEPINYILNVICLNCVYRCKGALKVSWPKWRIIIIIFSLSVMNIVFLYYKLEWLMSQQIDISDGFTAISHFPYLCIFVQYIIDAYIDGKFSKFETLNYYKTYETIDAFVGFKDFTRIRKSVFKSVVFYTVTDVLSSVLDFIAWAFGFSLRVTVIFSSEYLYHIIGVWAVIDIESHVLHVKERLMVMANLVQEYIDSSKVISITSNTWLNTSNNMKKTRLESLKTLKDDVYEFQLLIKCYYLLLEQTLYINNKYGIRMLLSSIVALVDCLAQLNLTIKVFKQSLATKTHFPAFTCFFRFYTAIAAFAGLVHECEKTYRQRERLIRLIDSILINKRATSNHTEESLKQLLNLVANRPVVFHAHNFFKLDYQLLASITSVVVTYTIIFLQKS